MTEAETEEVVAGVGHGDQPQLRQGEEQVEREGGEEEGEGDTGQDQRHPLVPLLLLLLSLSIRGEAGVDLEKLQDLIGGGLFVNFSDTVLEPGVLPGSEPRGGQ